MTFQIPENLDQFSIAGLEDLRRIAKTEFDALKAEVTIEDITDEQLTHLEDLQGFIFSTIPDEVASREEKTARFAAATTEPEDEEEADVEEEAAETPEDAVVASSKVTVANIKANGGGKVADLPRPTRQAMSTLVAAASVSSSDGNYENGQHLTSMLDVAKIFEARSAAHQSMDKSGVKNVGGPFQSPVATLIRNYPDEFSVNGDQTDYDKLLKVADETRLPGGSLLASVELERNRIKAETRATGTPWSLRRAGVHRPRRTTTSVSRSPPTAWPTSLRSRPVVVVSGTTPAWTLAPSSVSRVARTRPDSSTYRGPGSRWYHQDLS